MQNGNVVLNVPLFSLPEKGRLKLSFNIVGNGTPWQFEEGCDSDGSCWHSHWLVSFPNLDQGLRTPSPIGPSITPNEFPEAGALAIFRTVGSDIHPYTSVYNQWSVDEADGSNHPLFSDAAQPINMRSTDSSGYLLVTPAGSQPWNYTEGPSSYRLINGHGTALDYVYGVGSAHTATQTDPDGNSLSYSWYPGAGSYDDHVRPVFSDPGNPTNSTIGCPDVGTALQGFQNQPTVASTPWTVPGPGGSLLHLLICFGQISYHTNFLQQDGQPIISNYQNSEGGTITNSYIEAVGSRMAVQSIVLPDGTYWAFGYDSSVPNDTSSIAYASLTRVHLPQGGSISYSYRLGAPCPTMVDIHIPYNNTLVLESRTVTDVLGHSWTWQYHINQDDEDAVGNTVTDPEGNDTVYKYQKSPITQPNCRDIEATRTTYAGHAGSSAAVKQVTTAHSIVEDPLLGYFNVLKTSETTSLDNAASQTSYTHDAGFTAVFPVCSVNPAGTPCAPSGPSEPLSLGLETGYVVTSYEGGQIYGQHTDFKWQESNSPYLAANMLDTPSTVTEYGTSSATDLARTTYAYDESNHIECGGVKGHITSQTRWNNLGSDVTTSNDWSCSGFLKTKTDGNLQAIQYTPDSTGLFTESAQYPATNGITHTDHFTWDLNSGSMLTHTDWNGVQSSYEYSDPLGRITKARRALTTANESTTVYSYPSAVEMNAAADLHAKDDGLLLNKTCMTDSAGQFPDHSRTALMACRHLMEKVEYALRPILASQIPVLSAVTQVQTRRCRARMGLLIALTMQFRARRA
jgi:hypothetical protein